MLGSFFKLVKPMNLQDQIHQYPEPGSRMVMFRGDTMMFTLALTEKSEGKAWIRTNIGHASIARKAVINAVDMNIPPLGKDWFDIPMRQVNP